MTRYIALGKRRPVDDRLGILSLRIVSMRKRCGKGNQDDAQNGDHVCLPSKCNEPHNVT